MTEESDVRKNILTDKARIAADMVRSDKVSMEKGAELADMDVLDFRDVLRGSADA